MSSLQLLPTGMVLRYHSNLQGNGSLLHCVEYKRPISIGCSVAGMAVATDYYCRASKGMLSEGLPVLQSVFRPALQDSRCLQSCIRLLSKSQSKMLKGKKKKKEA